MNRRSFLKLSGALSLAVASGISASAPAMPGLIKILRKGVPCKPDPLGQRDYIVFMHPDAVNHLKTLPEWSLNK